MAKTVHLCEAFGMRLELHGGGAGNLQVLGAMGVPGEFYERRLLHPMSEYEKKKTWLKESVDPMDNEGYVNVSQKPRLGADIDWDHFESNTVESKKPRE